MEIKIMFLAKDSLVNLKTLTKEQIQRNSCKCIDLGWRNAREGEHIDKENKLGWEKEKTRIKEW